MSYYAVVDVLALPALKKKKKLHVLLKAFYVKGAI